MEILSRTGTGPDLIERAAQLDSPSTLVMLFASRPALETTTLVEDVHGAFPSSVVVGCSTAGHFARELVEDDNSVLVAARFEHTSLQTATASLMAPEESFRAGQHLAEELRGPDLRAVLVLSDGTACNGTTLVAGLVETLGDDVVVFGGLAADGDAFVQTVTVANGSANSHQVVAVGLFGDRLVIRNGTGGGWDLFGPERTITAAAGSVLTVLDGEPALDLYRRYLGDRADELPGSALLFPLAIREPSANLEHRVVRTVLGIDEDNKTMTFAGDMPIGWRAQLMRANFDSLVDGAADAAEAATEPAGVLGDSLCLGISCVGRRLVLGSRIEDELDAVAEILEDNTTFAGFYSYGELAPGVTGKSELHNQTMTLALLGER